MQRPNQTLRRGFTLTEMLVVIAIIAILAGLLFPVFRAARARARMSNCISKLHTIGQAVKQYQLDHKRYPRTLTDLQKYVDFQLDLNAPAFLAGKDKVLCPEDRRNAPVRDVGSSYGGFSANPNAPLPAPNADCNGVNPAVHPENCPVSTSASFGNYDVGNPRMSAGLANTFQRHWNYWGYDNDGIALCRGNTGECASPRNMGPASGQSPYFLHALSVQSGGPQFQTCGSPGALAPPNCFPVGIGSAANYPALANPTAPDNTIITRCYFQRPTSGNWVGTTWDSNAVDVVLYLGGNVKAAKTTIMGEPLNSAGALNFYSNPAKWVNQVD